ncbi:hypothetical protein CIB93_08915 [Streptomyces sp. WZ.A104]|nr:hypothetical protein CIB93_08915 [Streptomyces sp. WZ.A104]
MRAVLVEATVCDTCRRLGEPVVRYTITTSDGRKGSTDRCAEHGEPFEALLREPAPQSSAEKPKKAGRPRRRTQVTTVEEINRAKAEGGS